MTEFAASLANLNPSDPRANIASIKNAVASQIRSNDARVTIKTTDHFNHSFVPDLVLRWPNDTEERKVFFRTSFLSSDLVQDLATLAADHPIIMSLDHVPTQSGAVVDAAPEITEALTEASAESRTLITDPYGLEALQGEAQQRPVVGLLSRAVLQGGRGLIGEARARAAGESVGVGFEAAQTHDVPRTEAAVQETEALLDLPRANRISRLLQAVWVGSGASGASFPGATDVGASLDEASLRFLLELPDLEDDDFWRRIGSGLTTERICQLGDLGPVPNLQRLLKQGGQRLRAKACRVIRQDGQATELQWSVSAGTLRLDVLGEAAFFAPRHVKELPSAETESPRVIVANVRDRANQAGVLVEEVELATDARFMAYSSNDQDEDVSQDTTLSQFEGVLGPSTSVRALSLRLGGSTTVRCDFRTRTAAGRASAKYRLGDLVAVALPVLAQVNQPTFERLTALIDGDLYVIPEDIELEDLVDDEIAAIETPPADAEDES